MPREPTVLQTNGVISSYHWSDKDGEPDFAVEYHGHRLKIECKNIRSKELFRTPPSYKVELQKTRNSKDGTNTRGYRPKQRPSGHNITDKFRDNGGAIPPNLLTFGNNDSNGYYMEACKRAGIKPHPARFPIQVPSFFIRFLTDPSDLVLDPFAGSNTTGEACEREHRKWIAMELNESYLAGSRFRFDKRNLENLLPFEADPAQRAEEGNLVSLFD